MQAVQPLPTDAAADAIPKRYRWGLALAYLCVWTTLLLMPIPHWLLGKFEAEQGSWWSKIDLFSTGGYLVHFVGFAWLATAILWCARARDVRTLLWVGLSAGAYGALIEVLQLAVPGRMCDPWDILANLLGGFCGGWLLHARDRVSLWKQTVP